MTLALYFVARLIRDETMGKVRRLFGGGYDFVCGGGGKPLVIPYVNLFAIANTPPSILSNDIKTVENALPRVGWIRAKSCSKDVSVGEVTSFEDPSNKRGWVCKDLPSLLCQHG